MITLSTKWGQELAKMPETGMGYQIASITLKNGKKFNQAVIIEGNITQLRGCKDIPFNEDQIEKIIITHDKWNFREKNTLTHQP